MPPRLRLLIVFVYATGLLCLVGVVPLAGAAPAPATWQILLAMTAFGVCDFPLFHIRFGTHRYSFTWSELAVIVGLVLLPPIWLVPLATFSVLVAHTLARLDPIKSAFNALSLASAVTAAYAVMTVLGGPVERELGQPSAWVRLMVATTAYALWNALTVNAAVAFSQNVPLGTVATKGLLLKILVLAGNTLCATVIVVMAALQPATLFLVPCLLGLLYFVYGNYLRAMQERDTWQVLQATSRQLLRTERSEVAEVVLEQTGALLHAEFVELLLVKNPDDDSQGAVVFRRNVDGEVVQLEAPVQELAGSFWGRAACELEPFDIRHHAAVAAQQRDLEDHGLQLCIVAPLLVQEQCLGTLRIGFAGDAKLNGRDRQVFTTFANHVAGAVHNTRLFGEVRSKALHDPLTGLPNRALLADRLAHAQTRARRGNGGVAVLFLDLDRFKVVNDSLGHSVGDRLLVAVAERLTACIRPGDTAGRFGGDEFIVVCDDVNDEAEALRLAQRLVVSVEEPFVLAPGSEPIFLSASVGVAMATDGDDDPAAMIRDADAAMYQAKERGRSRCELFDHDMRERAVARLETENDLRRALERGELRLDYQAFVDVATQAVVGAEALVRWNHPRRGELNPGHFISLAEETGLIRPLGLWVLNEACAQLARWCRDEDWPPDFMLSVNLSPHQLSDPSLLSDITAALAATGVDPRMLCLEITESALVADMEAAMEVLERIRAIGVRIALDDFGTGYSSFSYLHRLPVDVLKIDRSFTIRLTMEPRDRAVVAGMINLAHALGLQTVAEGVETPGQLAELGGMDCNLAQGYYLSAPREASHVANSVLAGVLQVDASTT